MRSKQRERARLLLPLLALMACNAPLTLAEPRQGIESDDADASIGTPDGSISDDATPSLGERPDVDNDGYTPVIQGDMDALAPDAD